MSPIKRADSGCGTRNWDGAGLVGWQLSQRLGGKFAIETQKPIPNSGIVFGLRIMTMMMK
jgi:hypothetical protein